MTVNGTASKEIKKNYIKADREAITEFLGRRGKN